MPVNADKLFLEENKKFKAEMTTATLNGKKIILAKPTTFMNNSGAAVSTIANFYKIKPKNIWVITDDLDIPLGLIRVRHDGASGGHNGLEDIIAKLGDSGFARVRVGIAPIAGDPNSSSKPLNYLDAKEFVLSNFNEREEAIVQSVIRKAAIYIVEAIKINNLIATTIKL